MEQKTIVLCIAAAAVLLVLISLAWSRLSAWLAARELRHAYQARPLFSAHERAAYRTLKAMTDELGLVLFVKVRLLDLAEPRPHHRKYQLYLNKVSEACGFRGVQRQKRAQAGHRAGRLHA